MEKAAREGAPEIPSAEEIKAATEEAIVTAVKDEVKEAPSRIRKGLRRLAAVLWEGASVRSSASGEAMGSGLAGMYNAKWQALEQEYKQDRPDKR